MTFPKENPFTQEYVNPYKDLFVFLYNILYIGFFGVSIGFLNFIQILCPNKDIYTKIVKWYTRNVFSLAMPVRHMGYEGVPKEPTIVVANHSSLVDFILVNNVPFDCTEMISSGVFKKLWFMRRILRGSRNIVVEYGKKEKTIGDAVQNMLEGRNLFVFPEGDINSTENLTLPFRTGVFEIAKRTGCKIQPIVIRNSKYFAPYKPGNITTFNPLELPLEFLWLDPYTIPPTADSCEEADKLKKIYENELKIE